MFYAGYGALLTPSFGVAAAYGDDVQQYNNALGFFMIRSYLLSLFLSLFPLACCRHMCRLKISTITKPSADSARSSAVWTVFVLTFLIAVLPTNLVFILIFFFVDLGFLMVASSYFADADGHHNAAIGLKKTAGASCFVAGLIGWLVFSLYLSLLFFLNSYIHYGHSCSRRSNEMLIRTLEQVLDAAPFAQGHVGGAAVGGYFEVFYKIYTMRNVTWSSTLVQQVDMMGNKTAPKDESFY